MAISGNRTRRGSALFKALVLTGVLGGLGYGGYVLTQSDNGGATEVQAALIAASVGNFDITLVSTGEIQARRSTTVRSELETNSSIVSIVDEGTFVSQGDLLVELSSDSIRERLENELLEYSRVESGLVEAQNSLAIQESDNASEIRKAQVRIDLADLEMKKWLEGSDVEQQTQFALDIESAERELERLSEKRDRSEQLFEQEFLSGDQMKQDRLAHVRAEADLEKARLRQKVYLEYERQMEQKKLQNEIDESKAELTRVERQNASRLTNQQAGVSNAERQLNLRKQRVTKLEEQVEATMIYAPTDGLVVYSTSLGGGGWRNDDSPMEVGREIRSNEEIIQLPNSDEMVAEVRVHESQVGKVKIGQRVAVCIDALRGQIIDGTVASIGVVAETGGWRDPNLREYTVQVLLDIEDPADLGIKPSMRCKSTIYIQSVQDALHVPVPAVFFEGRSSVVYVDTGTGRFERREVRLGRRSDQQAEILAGLDTGERVLLRRPEPGEILDVPVSNVNDSVARAR